MSSCHQSSLLGIWIWHGILSISSETRDLGFRHWQHVYSAISRERRTALRCKEWCFNEFFSKQSIHSILDGKRHHSFAVPSQNVSEIPEVSAFDDSATCVHFVSWRFQLDFWDTWRPAWFLNRACALETDSHFDVPSDKMSATGEAVSSLHVRPISPPVVWKLFFLTSKLGLPWLRKSDFEDVNHVG